MPHKAGEDRKREVLHVAPRFPSFCIGHKRIVPTFKASPSMSLPPPLPHLSPLISCNGPAYDLRSSSNVTFKFIILVSILPVSLLSFEALQPQTACIK